MRFIDTNIVLYAFDDRDPSKQAIARNLLDEDVPTAVSAQVMLEAVASLPKILGRGSADDMIDGVLDVLQTFQVVAQTGDLVRAGLARARRSQLSIFDGLIVAAAQEAGASLLLTEDLNDGQRFDDVVVRNPFAASASA